MQRELDDPNGGINQCSIKISLDLIKDNGYLMRKYG
jgi:hypothetical protein